MKKMLSFLLAAVMIAAAVAVSLPAAAGSLFSDVENDRWSEASIRYAVGSGYMKGVGGDKFDPEGSLTRAMVATVLWRREGEPKPDAPSGFVDVTDGEWYADAVAWAKETGVVKGITDKTFEPDGLITREQLATMLFRFSSNAPVSVPERADLTPFADDEKVSDWADEPLEWAVQAGLIKGTDGNRLAPDGNATREQFAAIIERYDGSFKLVYNDPVPVSHYTEKEYPLVTDADIYVATDGDDGNPGSFGAPLATFAGAMSKVREIKETKTGGDIVVAFKAGDYRLDDLSFTAEDSGSEDQRIVYCAYGDGGVYFTAGIRVYADELEDLNDDDKTLFRESSWSKIKKIDLSGKVGDGELTRSSEAFTEEYGRLDAARYPNRSAKGDIYIEGMAEGIATGKTRIAVLMNRFKSYHTLDGAVMIGCIGHEYWKTVFPLTGYDPETGIITYDVIGPQYGLDEFARAVYFLNISEELDCANEFYVDPDRKALYLYKPDSDCYSVSTGEHFAVIDGANHLTFRGLDFSACTGEGFIITADDVTFDRCSVTGIGGKWGIKVYGTDFRMQDSELAYTAGCGMWFDSNKDVNDLVPTGPYVDNCLIHHAGQKWKNLQNPGIRIKRAVGAVVSHCEIYETPSAAISFGYVAEGGEERAIECVFEYNYLHDVANDLDDMGAVYTGRSFVNRDNAFRYNMIVRTSDAHTSFGVYLDDGVAAQKVYGNIFFDCGSLCLVNSGGQYADLHDNVCIRTFPLWGNEYHDAVIATAKYYWWVYDEDEEHPTAWNSGNFRILYNTLKKRPMPGDEYYELWHERWPELYEVIDDYDDVENPNCPATPGFNSVYNNYAIGYCKNWADETVERFAVKFGNNVDFGIDENPVFVNPTKGDYRIRDGVGFEEIKFEKIGRY